MSRRIISLVLSFGLLFQQVSFAQGAAELNIANYLSRIGSNLMQEKFRPPHLRYFSYDSLNDNFKVLLDKGDIKNLKTPELESSTKTLLSYFLVGVTLPDDMFWVNLRPDSEDQIIDPWLEKTDVGKIMLEADLQLKKDTASFTSPQTPEGREYWDKLYKKAAELYGYDNVSIPTLTRPWIVPGEIIVRESKDSAYVYKATLKVMLEQDYLKNSATYNFQDVRAKTLNEYSSQLIRELIIPKLTKEVNSSKRYAPLRQVYYSLILSRWFKLRFTGKTGTYASLINTRNITNLTSQEPWTKTTYFKQYQKSFQDGEYNIKEPVYTPTGQVIRSYFSGGINVASSAINTQNGIILPNDNVNKLGEVIGGRAVIDPQSISLKPTIVSSPIHLNEYYLHFMMFNVTPDVITTLPFSDIKNRIKIHFAAKNNQAVALDALINFLSENHALRNALVSLKQIQGKPSDEDIQRIIKENELNDAEQRFFVLVVQSGQGAGENVAKFVTLMVNKDLQGLDFRDVEKAIASGKMAIAEVSVDWAKKIKETYPDDVYSIFISPLSEEQIRERMRNEGQTWEEVILNEMRERQKERVVEKPTDEEKQLARAQAAIKEMARQNEYDIVIVSNQLKDLERDNIRWGGEEGAEVVSQFMSAVDNARKAGKKLILYSGPSATGKGPLWNQIQQRYGDQFSRIILYTTRKMRPGEQEGVDYYFRSVEQLKDLEKEPNASSPVKSGGKDLYIPKSADEAYDAVIATLTKIRGTEFPIFEPKIDKSKVEETFLTRKITIIGSVVLGYDAGPYSHESPVTVNFSEGIIVLDEDYYSDTTRYSLERPAGSSSSAQTERSTSNSMRRFNESRIREDLFIILHSLGWARKTVLSDDERTTIKLVEEGHHLAGPGTGDYDYMDDPSYVSLKNAYDAVREKISSTTDARITEIIEWVKSDPERNLTGEEVHVLDVPVVKQVGVGPEVRAISIDRVIAEKFGFPYEKASSLVTPRSGEQLTVSPMRPFNEGQIRKQLDMILHNLRWAYKNIPLLRSEETTIESVEERHLLAGPGTDDDHYQDEPGYRELREDYQAVIAKMKLATDARITEIINWVKNDPEKNLTGEEVRVLEGTGPEARVIGSIDRGIAEKFGFVYETTSSPIQSVPKKTGGIDFRILPMTIQPMGSFSGLNFKLPQLSQAELRQINVDSEIKQIKNMVQSGITPSGERIKELIAACVQKGEINSQVDNLLLCLIDIFKLEEESASESSPELREALVIVDSQS